jgi:hypothetical protein
MWLVRCRRCLRRTHDVLDAPVVAVLDSGELPRWTLAPVRDWAPGGIGGRGIYTVGEVERRNRAVELWCPVCAASCGAWRARTLANRLIGTDGRGLLVPDLPVSSR